MARNVDAVKISQHKRRAFLRVLAETGRPQVAAQEAGYADTSFLRRLRREDDDFAREWDEAVEAAGDKFEDEAVRRGVEGVREPEYYRGQVVGFKIKYSDQLLMMLLKGAKPKKYSDKTQTDINVNGKIGVAVLPMTAPSLESWEAAAVQMHDNQSLLDLEETEYQEVEATERRTERS